MMSHLRRILSYFTHPITLARDYQRSYLRPDLVAGLTVAVLALPQGMAYALVAELPPQMGLYAAIIGAIVGSLWGSSDQMQTGPTNATSLLVLSTLVGVVAVGTPEYLAAAGLMALMVGLFRLLMGIARLGALAAFVSDSVIVGFTAGAAILIAVNQLRYLLRLDIPSSALLRQTVPAIAGTISSLHWISLLIGASTILAIITMRRYLPKLPAPLLALVLAALLVGLLRLDRQGVSVIGALPRSLPPLTKLPLRDLNLIGKLISGSLAVAAIELVQVLSIARGIASRTGQRLDANQEFVGQGLANIASGFFSGYTCSGSFVRSAVSYDSGAKTRLAAVFSGLIVLAATLLLAPLAGHIPLSALAGVLMVTAAGLVDQREIARIWRSGQGDRVIMVTTLVATLVLPLQFAVLGGIVFSIGHYLLKTSTPRVRPVFLSDDFRYFQPDPEKLPCTQLGVLEVLGDLYFGAVSHIEDRVRQNLESNPSQRFLLLRMYSIENCDISGIHALESIVRHYRERGGDVFFVHVQAPIQELMRSTGFLETLGERNLLDPDAAIDWLFHRVLDPVICIYECPRRAFRECQNLPKHLHGNGVSWEKGIAPDVPAVSPKALWEELHSDSPPLVIDVREPREFRRRHISDAVSIPLATALSERQRIPRDRPVVLVCRAGRRSARAAAALAQQGYSNVRIVEGGIAAWEQDNLLEAIGQ